VRKLEKKTAFATRGTGGIELAIIKKVGEEDAAWPNMDGILGPWTDFTQRLTRLMFWRRSTPRVPQTALFLDAELQIMLMELHYPLIVHGAILGPHTRAALSLDHLLDEFQFHCRKPRHGET
jgi:hypothetical protein